jgi:hypothetical protein
VCWTRARGIKATFERHPYSGCDRSGTEAAVSLVTKVKDAAGGLYSQAKSKYEGSEAMQKAGKKAGQQAGQAAGKLRDLSGKANSSDTAGKLRDLTGKAASSQAAGKLRDFTGKAAGTLKGGHGHGPADR